MPALSSVLRARAQLISKILAEPDLAAAFQKPKVMQAIMEAQQDPMAMLKYQDDPDVKMVRTMPKTLGLSPQHCKQTLLVVDRSLLLLPVCAAGTPA